MSFCESFWDQEIIILLQRGRKITTVLAAFIFKQFTQPQENDWKLDFFSVFLPTRLTTRRRTKRRLSVLDGLQSYAARSSKYRKMALESQLQCEYYSKPHKAPVKKAHSNISSPKPEYLLTQKLNFYNTHAISQMVPGKRLFIEWVYVDMSLWRPDLRHDYRAEKHTPLLLTR